MTEYGLTEYGLTEYGMTEYGMTEYDVVVNDDGQYSVWAVGTEPPAGWHRTGFTGTRAECLAHVDDVWTEVDA
jgi:MbtH protein